MSMLKKLRPNTKLLFVLALVVLVLYQATGGGTWIIFRNLNYMQIAVIAREYLYYAGVALGVCFGCAFIDLRKYKSAVFMLTITAVAAVAYVVDYYFVSQGRGGMMVRGSMPLNMYRLYLEPVPVVILLFALVTRSKAVAIAGIVADAALAGVMLYLLFNYQMFVHLTTTRSMLMYAITAIPMIEVLRPPKAAEA